MERPSRWQGIEKPRIIPHLLPFAAKFDLDMEAVHHVALEHETNEVQQRRATGDDQRLCHI